MLKGSQERQAKLTRSRALTEAIFMEAFNSNEVMIFLALMSEDKIESVVSRVMTEGRFHTNTNNLCAQVMVNLSSRHVQERIPKCGDIQGHYLFEQNIFPYFQQHMEYQ